MISNNVPTYEELKNIYEKLKETDDEYSFSLYYPLYGGYFRLKLNEDRHKNIAIDYLEGGFLCYINRHFKSKYKFSHLYKFNKKNYEGLVKLYKEMLITTIQDCEQALKGIDSNE